MRVPYFRHANCLSSYRPKEHRLSRSHMKADGETVSPLAHSITANCTKRLLRSVDNSSQQ